MVDFLHPEIKNKKILSPLDGTIDYSWIKPDSCDWLNQWGMYWFAKRNQLFSVVKDDMIEFVKIYKFITGFLRKDSGDHNFFASNYLVNLFYEIVTKDILRPHFFSLIKENKLKNYMKNSPYYSHVPLNYILPKTTWGLSDWRKFDDLVDESFESYQDYDDQNLLESLWHFYVSFGLDAEIIVYSDQIGEDKEANKLHEMPGMDPFIQLVVSLSYPKQFPDNWNFTTDISQSFILNISTGEWFNVEPDKYSFSKSDEIYKFEENWSSIEDKDIEY